MTNILAAEIGCDADEPAIAEVTAEEKAAESAKGIPDRAYYGKPDKIPANTELDFIIQRHLARRAGPHFDVRFGDESGLHSWVARKPMPGPGGRIGMFHQPMHSYKYKDFEGTIPEGYGAGTVKKHEEGKLIITKTSPGMIHFTVTHRKHPERFALFKPKTQTTGRKDDWLLVNVTPTKPLPYQKVRYKRVGAEEVESKLKAMQEGDSVEAKVDGASSLIQLLKDGVEVVSYRAAKDTGRPIIHTERVLGGRPQLSIPEELQGSVLKGEIYGKRDDDGVIPPQELGGLLNATVANSLQMQRDRDINLRDMVYDVQQYGKDEVPADTPRADRRELLKRILQHLPADKFHLSDAANSPEEALELWRSVQSGKHPLTTEGVVGWPQKGHPWKAKLTEDSDVHITSVFPGEGKYLEQGAGGFEYSLEPGGKGVGRVGTGFSDETRRDMMQNPDKYIGRVARIRSQQQLPSGAYRAPSFKALHEDYPQAKTSADKAEKGASFYQQALTTTPIQYNTDQSVWQNILRHLHRVHDTGTYRLRAHENLQRWRDSLSAGPSAKIQRTLAALDGRDPYGVSKIDRALQSFNIPIKQAAFSPRQASRSIANYLRGRKIAKLPDRISQGVLDAVGEENRLLAHQQNPISRWAERPFFHLKDRIVGGAAGGLAGGIVDDQLRQHDGGAQDYATRGVAATGGALLGGRGLNAAMNSARRYVAAKSPLFGYAPPAPGGVGQTVRDWWRYGVKGEPRRDFVQRAVDRLAGRVGDDKRMLQSTFADKAESAIGGDKGIYAAPDEILAVADFHRSAARHELLKRYLGIHAPGKFDYYVRDPVTRAYKYNPDTVKPGTTAHRTLLEDPLAAQPWLFETGTGAPPRYSSEGPGPLGMVFGSHDMRMSGKPKQLPDGGRRMRYTVGDAWNMAIDPNERDLGAYLSGLARTSPQKWLEYLSQRPLLTEESLRNVGSGDTIGGRLSSAGLRQLLESVLRQHTPVYRQRLAVDFNPYGGIDRVQTR